MNGKTQIAIALSLLLATSTALAANSIADRIAPIGQIRLAKDAVTAEIPKATPSAPRTGKEIYNTYCISCHASGIAGAPMLGDKAAWAPRLTQARSIINDHVINGFNAMPARGTCMNCTNEELIKTIDYMISQ